MAKYNFESDWGISEEFFLHSSTNYLFKRVVGSFTLYKVWLSYDDSFWIHLKIIGDI